MANPPNFLVFVLDDLEEALLDTLLKANKLPNIKSKILDGAIRFRNAYVPTSMCSPSRASLLTGKFAHNHGVWNVVGSEGPGKFGDYLNATGDAYLPTWLGDTHYSAFIGKYHLSGHAPNWDFYRPVQGYDLRPGMYRARVNRQDIFPPVYQTKYIGDSAKEAIAAAGNRPFFLVVAPTAIHVNVFEWRQMHSFRLAGFTGMPVAFTQFYDESAKLWRQHLITAEKRTSGLYHQWWERTSASRDHNWPTWVRTGDENLVAPNTGSLPVVGWSVLTVSPTIKRQQMVRASGTDVEFYSRDIERGIASAWTKTGDESILAGTGQMPVVGWASTVLPSGNIRQQVVRGSEVGGYESFARHRDVAANTMSPWSRDPDFGETVVFGRFCGFNLIPTGGSRYVAQLMQQRTGSSGYEYWQSPEIVDFHELAKSGNDARTLGDASKFDFPDEGESLSKPFLRYRHRRVVFKSDENQLERNDPDAPRVITPVHPYYLMRAYAEGSWTPVAPGQTYNWTGNYPAGSLRANRDREGKTPASSQFRLPESKTSFNRQVDNELPYFAEATWPDLTDPVWGGQTQRDYLQRLYLDRLEQMLSIDRMVGEVVAAAGQNTIIVFTSDNGHFNGEHRLSNKIAPHEESTRIPLYIKVPGAKPREVERLVANIDIAPTLLEYAGKQWDSTSFNVDGRSLRPLLENRTVDSWRTSLLLQYRRPRDYPQDAGPTDWRFGLPDYLGLRVAAEASGSRADTVYYQYASNIDIPFTNLAYEYYRLSVDPQQVDNLTEVIIPELDLTMRQMYAASGSDMRDKDSSPIA